MVGEIILELIFLCLFWVVSSNSIIQILYLFQLNTYSLKSIYVNMYEVFKGYIIYWFLYLIIAICFFVLKVSEYWLLFLTLILIGTILIVLGNKFKNIRKVKYTRRMILLIVVTAIITILESILVVCLVSREVYIILLPLVLMLAYLNVGLASVILMPVEYLIAMHYIKMAKKKLSENKKLIKVGITGSFGKTSTKEILLSILKEEFNVLATPKNFNTPLGITKTINNEMQNINEIFICEMGAKKRGEIKYLCDLVGVDCGIVTSVGRQHTSTFGSIENVYKTKKELPDALYNKICVFNLMNIYTMQMYKEFVGEKVGVFLLHKRNMCIKSTKLKNIKCQLIKSKCNYRVLYEFPKKNNYYAKSIICTENGSFFEVWYNGKQIMSTEIKLIGLHNVINAMLAIALSFKLGMSKENISLGLTKVKSINARLEKTILSNGAIVLNNGYNSNIDSARFALDTLNLFNRLHKVVITPGLIETDNDYRYNEKFGRLISEYATEVVIVKEKNKGAILNGLISSNFDMCNVVAIDEFKDALKIINNADCDYVFLIENDLPDNFK